MGVGMFLVYGFLWGRFVEKKESLKHIDSTQTLKKNQNRFLTSVNVEGLGDSGGLGTLQNSINNMLNMLKSGNFAQGENVKTSSYKTGNHDIKIAVNAPPHFKVSTFVTKNGVNSSMSQDLNTKPGTNVQNKSLKIDSNNTGTPSSPELATKTLTRNTKTRSPLPTKTQSPLSTKIPTTHKSSPGATDQSQQTTVSNSKEDGKEQELSSLVPPPSDPVPRPHSFTTSSSSVSPSPSEPLPSTLPPPQTKTQGPSQSNETAEENVAPPPENVHRLLVKYGHSKYS